MRIIRLILFVMIGLAILFSVAMAQTPAPGQRGGDAPGQRGAADARGGGGRGGRGGGAAIASLMVNSTAWPDGGTIPLRYTQVGGETSPGVQWGGAPQGTVSYVLTFHDADSVVANSTDGLLHWMVWNIPGTTTNLPPGQPDGFQLENGMWQISVSGSRYRGPGAPAAGPLHHYILEVYALDTMLDVKVPSQGPQDPNPNVQTIRTSIMQAMVGHIRGKGSYVGLFHRPE